MTKDFLKQVFAGEKQLMKKEAIMPIHVPFYEELSVKAMWPMFADDQEFCSYFPDKYPKGKGPPREYFFNILGSLHGDYLTKCINHAHKQRHGADGQKLEREAIKMSQFWEEQLASMPYLSRKYPWLSKILIHNSNL